MLSCGVPMISLTLFFTIATFSLFPTVIVIFCPERK